MLTSLIAAIIIDVITMLARRNGWSPTRQIVTVSLVSLIVCLPVMPVAPLLTLGMIRYVGIAGFGLSLLLGLLGAFVGVWFGQRMGAAITHIEGNA